MAKKRERRSVCFLCPKWSTNDFSFDYTVTCGKSCMVDAWYLGVRHIIMAEPLETLLRCFISCFALRFAHILRFLLHRKPKTADKTLEHVS